MNASDCLLASSATILDAITCIDRSQHKIALVTDERGRLVGTITDGDVRRALLRNLALATPAAAVMNRNPRIAPVGSDDARLFRLMQAMHIRHLPLVDDDGRVVDLRSLDEIVQGHRNPNRVVLMAGGLGARLRPLTHQVPKPMLPVGGRPLLETILETFVDQGFYRFAMSINYLGDMIADHFGDGSRWGVEIEYVRETTPMGTAGSLTLLTELPEEPFIVMNGDILTSVDFRQMLQFHNDNEAMATVALHEHIVQLPYGVVEVEEHRLISITEKPIQHHFINAGIYVLDPAALDRIPHGAPYTMPELIQKLTIEGGKTAAFPIREYWIDIGQHQDLHRAQSEFDSVFRAAANA